MGPAEIYKAMGQRIRTAREALGLRQEELASAVSLTRTSITNIELGKQRLLAHTVCDIAEALRVEPAELMPRLAELMHMPEENPPAREDLTPREWEWIQSVMVASKGSD